MIVQVENVWVRLNLDAHPEPVRLIAVVFSEEAWKDAPEWYIVDVPRAGIRRFRQAQIAEVVR